MIEFDVNDLIPWFKFLLGETTNVFANRMTTNISTKPFVLLKINSSERIGVPYNYIREYDNQIQNVTSVTSNYLLSVDIFGSPSSGAPIGANAPSLLSSQMLLRAKSDNSIKWLTENLPQYGLTSIGPTVFLTHDNGTTKVQRASTIWSFRHTAHYVHSLFSTTTIESVSGSFVSQSFDVEFN